MVARAPADRSSETLQGVHGRVLEAVRSLRSLQASLGRDLLCLKRRGSFTSFETTTFGLYCEKVGLSVAEGRDLAALAEVSEARPEVGEAVSRGWVTLSQASMVNEVRKHPALERPGEDWLLFAMERTTLDLRRLLDHRREEVRLGEAPVSLDLEVSRKGCAAFRRCRELVSRRAGHLVTAGQAFETVCDDYLQRHDPERKAERLAPKDGETKASLEGNVDGRAWVDGRRRALSEATKRAIVRRCGDRCWVKGCPNRVFLQYAHLHPVRAGGSNFPWELVRLCFDHHRQFDGGLWRLVPKADGSVVLIDVRGVRVGELVRWEDVLAAPSDRPPPAT